jgi:prepilin-type N-terminal cleavage/methylation domain-containing protein/prepilin-type processing-associated H-X9-DG protein
MKKKGFTLIELLVVISIIAMLLAILMPALSKVKKIAQRVVCATNLKGLGTAQTVYSQDYDDEYAVQGDGKATVLADRTTGWSKPDKRWETGDNITIGASLYLLVREADVSPKSFVCPAGEESEYDGSNERTPPRDIIELYDFGGGTLLSDGYPYEHVSYAYQMPYSTTGTKSPFAADGTSNASFAVMADKNPWFDAQITLQDAAVWTDAATWSDAVARIERYYDESKNVSESHWSVKAANAYSHGRDGQNVVFADGHASFEKTMDVGVQNDAIYVPYGGSTDDEAAHRRGDTSLMPGITDPAAKAAIQPAISSDSYLVNDSYFKDNPIAN